MNSREGFKMLYNYIIIILIILEAGLALLQS